ncbi:MAG: Nif3-like dinuclear metal center hexameric protein [Bacteroidales bacterium]|nr:Nif3-like dinuclear metal center hexameric protein [Bacteroidales bacterium]
MKVSDVIKVLEDFAPSCIQEDWDNSGLSVGSPQAEVTGIMLGFDCTPELVDEAIEAGANMIITHHPLIFGRLRSICPEDPVGLAIIKAIKGGVAVYSAHTTADKVPGGVSWAMAERLGLQDIRILDGEQYGLGVIGKWPQALEWEQAAARVKDAFGIKTLRCSKPSGPIDTVAMCGGSGSSLIAKAREAGAQLYLCGDISYHHFFTPDGFALMDVGHFESEVEIVDVLYSLLRKNFPNFVIRASANLNNSNPVKYY